MYEMSCKCKCRILLLARPTGWRNDAVHAQVFHHLAIMIKTMGHGKGVEEKAGGLALSYGDTLVVVLCCQSLGGAVPEREGVFQELDDVGLGSNGSRAVFIAGIHGRFLAQRGREEFIVGGG